MNYCKIKQYDTKNTKKLGFHKYDHKQLIDGVCYHDRHQHAYIKSRKKKIKSDREPA